MNIFFSLIATTFLVGCSSITTTYKAKSQGWSKIIEAKTIIISEIVCEKHAGYFKSYQYEIWHDYDNGNYYEYNKVDIICYDGYTETIPIETINAEVTPIVDELY